MADVEKHAMVVVKTYDSGAEEWYCPTCGRRFVIQWPPEYRRIVLEQGNEHVVHSGGSGGLSMGDARVSRTRMPSEDIQVSGNVDPHLGADDDPYLGPWARYLDDLDL